MTEENQMETVFCPICGPEAKFTVRYPAKFVEADLAFVARKTPTHTHFRVVRCDGCGLVYSNPRISQEKILKLYAQSQFISEPQLQNMLRDYLGEIEKIVPRSASGNFLDVGCSNGFLLKEAQARYPSLNVFGIEPGEQAVRAADDAIRNHILTTELKDGLFPESFFDFICFFQVFDHITEPNRFLQRVRHYLKPGGLVLAIHHNIRSLLPTLLGLRASTYDISHMFLWDKCTMRRILEKNGFRVVSIKNMANSYQLDHVVRMLPLPATLKAPLRNILQQLHLAEHNIRACVENMKIVAAK